MEITFDNRTMAENVAIICIIQRLQHLDTIIKTYIKLFSSLFKLALKLATYYKKH